MPDPEILAHLANAAFERHDIGSQRFFFNRSSWGFPRVKVAYTRCYPTIEDAQRAKILLDAYVHCAGKGTSAYPSEDRLTRAFIEADATRAALDVTQHDERVTLDVLLECEPKEELRAAGRAASLAAGMFDEPRFTQDQKTFLAAAQEIGQAIAARISNHSGRAAYHMRRAFHPELSPIDDDAERALLLAATPASLAEVVAAHRAQSHVTVLYVGEQEIDTLAGSLAPLLPPSPLGEEVLSAPKRYARTPGAPVHVDGPAQHLTHVRTYAFSKEPRTIEERAALEVAGIMVGGGWMSLLMEEARHKRNLVYNINGLNVFSLNQYLVQTQHAHAAKDEIARLTDDTVRAVACGEFSDERLALAKERAVEKLLVMEGRGDLISSIQPLYRMSVGTRRHITLEMEHSLEEAYLALDRLTPGRVREIVSETLSPVRVQEFTYGRTA